MPLAGDLCIGGFWFSIRDRPFVFQIAACFSFHLINWIAIRAAAQTPVQPEKHSSEQKWSLKAQINQRVMFARLNCATVDVMQTGYLN
jgi:hypothetical protein